MAAAPSPDRVVTSIAGDTVLVEVFRMRDDPSPTTVVEVAFALGGGVPLGVRAVRVQSMGDPLKPSTLQRLPWARYLEIADGAIRWRYAKDLQAMKGPLARQAKATRGLMGEKSCPGRKPLPDDHYRRIADRYLELRASGENPIAVIAEEEKQNRNTVAGWVRKARERGYLPPGRTGRAG